jgi:trimeric autotransporter adhesin
MRPYIFAVLFLGLVAILSPACGKKEQSPASPSPGPVIQTPTSTGTPTYTITLTATTAPFSTSTPTTTPTSTTTSTVSNTLTSTTTITPTSTQTPGVTTTPTVCSSGCISTLAGIGTPGYSGDGGLALNAQFNMPTGVAEDSNGNLYIADWGNNVVRKIDVAGYITTVAGTGTYGYSGDNGSALAAELGAPHSVVLDSVGNLYIADSGNNRIRKVDTNGLITTVVGTGGAGYSGDGGPAISAEMYNPVKVTFGGDGNMYIGEEYLGLVRKVDADGIITTVAGTSNGYSGDGGLATAAQFRKVYGVFVTGTGEIYIADVVNNRIRWVNTDGIINTVVGTGTFGNSGDGGLAIQATLANSKGVILNALGEMLIADTGNSKIRKVDTAGYISTLAGDGIDGYSGDGGLAVSARLNRPSDVYLSASGAMIIADTLNHRIRRVSP